MREWWVANEPNGKNISNTIELFTATKVKPQNPPWTHVIEKSAYDEMKWEYENVCKFATQYEEERDDAIERLRKIEIANKEWTRNDAVTFGKLFDELATANELIKIKDKKIAELRKKISLQEQIMDENK